MQIFIVFRMAIRYNHCMIHHVLCLCLLPVCLYAYDLLISPPVMWLTHVVIVFTWFASLCLIGSGCCSMIVHVRPVRLHVLRRIRARFDWFQACYHSVAAVVTGLLLLNHGYLITSIITWVAAVCFMVFFYNFCVYTPTIVSKPGDFAATKQQILQCWEQGDFAVVLKYLQQCDARELQSVSQHIRKNHGEDEHELLRRLID